MKQAILLLTNRTDDIIRNRYAQLANDYGEKADIYLLFDNSSSTDSHELERFKKIYTFSIQELVAEGYTALKEGFLGNCQYPLLKFRQDYPEYDFYWQIEDDVVFSGDWSVLFEAFANDTSDLVSAKIRTYADDPTWGWWKSVKAPQGVAFSTNEMFASFAPVFRLSGRALDCLEDEMRKGWRGHFEALIPMMTARHGLSMLDIGGKGRFVKKRFINRFYSEDTHTWIPLRVQPIKPNMIYHPIKEKAREKTDRRNCLLSIVGKNSCHKEWIAGNVNRNFDVHLIVYDESFGNYYNDAEYIYGKRGRKTQLILDYFNHHQQMHSQYHYFLYIDENMSMTATRINDFFDEMVKKERLCNFTEKGMPCFSYKITWIISFSLRVLDVLVRLLRAIIRRIKHPLLILKDINRMTSIRL